MSDIVGLFLVVGLGILTVLGWSRAVYWKRGCLDAKQEALKWRDACARWDKLEAVSKPVPRK